MFLHKLLLLSVLMFTGTAVYGQTFSGTTNDQTHAYSYTLSIHNDSTVGFIYERDNRGIYAQHKGTIRQLNDTLFHINTEMQLGQFYMKTPYTDTLYIQIDKALAGQLRTIELEYADGSTKQQLQVSEQSSLLKIPVNKALFNAKKGKDHINISTRSESLTGGQLLTFRIPFGSAASFTQGGKEDFYVVIKEANLYTSGTPPLQTGHFSLKRSSN